MKKRIFTILIIASMLTAAMPVMASANPTAEEPSVENSMKIYGIYMQRQDKDTTDDLTKDRYGDATLIESDGQYLLIDTGAKYPVKGDKVNAHTSDLVDTLKNIGVTKLDVLITHNHRDHVGGIYDVLENFEVGNVYVSSFTKSSLSAGLISGIIEEDETVGEAAGESKEELIEDISSEAMTRAEEEGAEELSENIDDEAVIETIEGTDDILKSVAIQQADNQDVQLKILEIGDVISFGAVSGKVLGPVGGYTIDDMVEEETMGTKLEHFTNNMSMSVMFTCGNTKFLTCGDAEKEEEASLINKYGDELSADILKASHHGLRTSSTEDFVKIVNPTYSFAHNHGYTNNINYVAMFNLWKYSRDYIRIANLKHTLVITDDDDWLSINPECNPDNDTNFTERVEAKGYVKLHTMRENEKKYSEDTEPKPGDANGDGVISAADLTTMAKHFAGISIVTDQDQLQNFDADGNGKNEVNDITHLARYIAKLIDNL